MSQRPATPPASSTVAAAADPAIPDTPNPNPTPISSSQRTDEDNAVDSAQKLKRQRQPRNSACQSCAALKMKCVVASLPNAFGKCERCHRMQRECLPSVPKPRKRRAHSVLGDGSPNGTPAFPLSQLLNHRTPPPMHNLTVRTDETKDTVKDSLLLRHDLSHNDSLSFKSLLNNGLNLDATSDYLLNGVDYTHVEASFTIFRNFSAHFPFVSLRADADAIHMAADRPMMTIAVCIVTASAKPHTQQRLVQAFRLALSRKFITATAERGPDLLLGLLTYLAWQHHHSPHRPIYADLSLLAGIATNLGLYRSRFPFQSQSPSSLDLDCQRAFLGCYHLCCRLSVMALRQPSPMRWTDNLHQCAMIVTQFDRDLGTVVGNLALTHLIEELDEAMRSVGTSSAQHTELHVKNILGRQRALKRDHPDISGTLGFSAATIHFHHRLLQAIDPPATTTLINAACAVKEHVDDLLARDPATLHQLAVVDWTNLLETLVVMVHIARPPPPASSDVWEAGAIFSTLQPEALLAALLAHLDRANARDNLVPHSERILHAFRAVGEHLTQRLADDQRGNRMLGNFRPVNDVAGSTPGSLDVEAFEDFANGVMDDAFWAAFSRSAVGADR